MSMKTMASNPDSERFLNGVDKYAAYLKTVEGRLRLDLAFANLHEFLPHAKRPLQVLDLGCGTGDIAIRLARLGLQVTLLDTSRAMLDSAERAAREAEVEDRIVLKHGDAEQLANLFPAESFAVILCHNILEYVADPCAVLCSAARLLRDSSGIMSVLVRNQAGEVLKAAIKEGDFALAGRNLTSEWGLESLYGGRVQLFTTARLLDMLTAAALEVTTQRGVRVVSDYLPSTIAREDEYEQILALEHKLGSRREFAAIARYTHCLARRTDSVTKDGV